MARPARLDADAVRAALDGLPGWELRDGRLHRRLRFADFPAAFGFMAAVATVAQQLDHHPDWSNSWATVDVELSTHDVGGLTQLDVTLATRISELAERFGT